MARKRFQDLKLTDAFLFAVVMQDEEICHDTLELLLGQKVGKVHVSVEHTVLYNSDCRSIRLDVYARTDGTDDYDLEMQGTDSGNLPKRSRFYQAEMDTYALEPGQDPTELLNNTIIFICTFDPFGKGKYRYVFSNRCEEIPDLELGDGTKKIFLNTEGTNPDEVPAELVQFLQYVKDGNGECINDEQDRYLSRLHQHVTAVKRNRETERRYMTVEDLINIEKKKSVKETSKRMVKLWMAMSANGEGELISKLEDEAFLEEMLEKYQLLEDEDY